MSDTGINETPYPATIGTTIVDWGPGFEGEPAHDNEFSADALLYGGDIVTSDEGSNASLVIALARREEGPEALTPQVPVTVGIEMNRADLVALRDWATACIGQMDDYAGWRQATSR